MGLERAFRASSCDDYEFGGQSNEGRVVIIIGGLSTVVCLLGKGLYSWFGGVLLKGDWVAVSGGRERKRN